MNIVYFDSRLDFVRFFTELSKKSFGYYGLAPNGDFFRSKDARWDELERSVSYPWWSVLFNVMKDTIVKFEGNTYILNLPKKEDDFGEELPKMIFKLVLTKVLNERASNTH